MTKYFVHAIQILTLSGFLSLSALAQAQNRAIYLSSHGVADDEQVSDDGEDTRPLLELIDIQVAGGRINPDKPFVADENWLRTLKLKVKNVSGRPLTCLGLSFGLLEGIDQELEPRASWPDKFGFTIGTFIDDRAEVKTAPKIVLRPGEEVELTHDNLGELSQQVLERAGTFHKAEFLGVTAQFADGTWRDGDLLIRRK